MREQQGRKNAAEEGYGHIWKCSIVYRMIYIYICMCVCVYVVSTNCIHGGSDEATMRS